MIATTVVASPHRTAGPMIAFHATRSSGRMARIDLNPRSRSSIVASSIVVRVSIATRGAARRAGIVTTPPAGRCQLGECRRPGAADDQVRIAHGVDDRVEEGRHRRRHLCGAIAFPDLFEIAVAGLVQGMAFCLIIGWALRFVGLLVSQETLSNTFLVSWFMDRTIFVHLLGI